MPEVQDGRLAYLFAFGIGIAFSVWLFAGTAAFLLHPLDRAFTGDEAQTVIAQRYFIADAWRWPIFLVPRLNAPDGTNILSTDSIPLAALLLKAFRSWLPAGFTLTSGWAAIALALQPPAAVFALRSAGEKRLLAGIAICIIAISIPSLLLRESLHPSLSSHFLILLAIGLYFLLVKGSSAWLWLAAGLLLVTALLVHPYLLVMCAAILAAAPLSALVANNPSWRRLAIGTGAVLVLIAIFAFALGSARTEAPDDYGLYSMNLFAPFTPTRSTLFHAGVLDATGGQILEGYQYLGVGVLLLTCTAAFAAISQRRVRVRHAGLAIVCVALFFFALSSRVYAGHALLVDFGRPPSFLRQFHGNGRFFWPVSYVIVVGSLVSLGRHLEARWFIGLALTAAVIQFMDTTELRAADHGRARVADSWIVPRLILAPLLADADRVTLWPTARCGAPLGVDSMLMQVLLLASADNLATNTMYTSHVSGSGLCEYPQPLTAPVKPQEIRIFLPPERGAYRLTPDFPVLCHDAGPMTLCAEPRPGMDHLEPLRPSYFPLGRTVGAADDSFRDSLGSGWEQHPTAEAVWMIGQEASLIMELPPSVAFPTHLTLVATAIAPVKGGEQTVRVLAQGQVVAELSVPDMAYATWTIKLPASHSRSVTVTFQMAHPVKPVDRGVNADPRELGLLVKEIRLSV